MDISAKYSCAHSHVLSTGHSNLANSKFTLEPRVVATVHCHEKEPSDCKRDFKQDCHSLISWLHQMTCLNPSLNQPKRQKKEIKQGQLYRRAAYLYRGNTE